MSCGYGTRTGNRSCDNPTPLHGGKDCVGDTTVFEQCVDELCVSNESSLYVNVSIFNTHMYDFGLFTQNTCSKSCSKYTQFIL